jgi:hypothetical protein
LFIQRVCFVYLVLKRRNTSKSTEIHMIQLEKDSINNIKINLADSALELYVIKLTHQTSGQVEEFALATENDLDDRYRFTHFAIDTDGLPVGEYLFEVLTDNTIVYFNKAKIGYEALEPVQYQATPSTRKSYNG